MKDSNNESKDPMKPDPKTFVAGDSVVPAGRTVFRVGFPGTVCLANIRCRVATLRRKDFGRTAANWLRVEGVCGNGVLEQWSGGVMGRRGVKKKPRYGTWGCARRRREEFGTRGSDVPTKNGFFDSRA